MMLVLQYILIKCFLEDSHLSIEWTMRDQYGYPSHLHVLPIRQMPIDRNANGKDSSNVEYKINITEETVSRLFYRSNISHADLDSGMIYSNHEALHDESTNSIH